MTLKNYRESKFTSGSASMEIRTFSRVEVSGPQLFFKVAKCRKKMYK